MYKALFKRLRYVFKMEFTEYFLHTRKRQDRAIILYRWIKKAVDGPVKEEIQTDGRIRRWTWINEQNKFLRVILLPDGKTIHNAFFDRYFKE